MSVTRPTHRHAQGQQSLAPAVLAGVVLVIVAIAAVDVAVQLGARLGHWRQPPPVSPAQLFQRLAAGRTRWPVQATPILIAEAVVILVLIALCAVVAVRLRRSQRASDRAARLMRPDRHSSPVGPANAKRTAQRLGIETPGLLVARSIAGGQPLLATWEDMMIDVWGPRRGKTVSRAIPTVLAAPGAALATSNKPDLYAACAGPRGETGRVWNFDPQRITGDQPAGWWWNPLSYVTSDQRARELTAAFVDAYRPLDARPDTYFDPAGQDLVSNLLHAAALADRPITDVFLWSKREGDEEPARILQAHGMDLAAASVHDVIALPPEQRGGVYGTASQMLSFLRDPDLAPWVCDQHDRRPQLDLAAFVNSQDTLFLHSKEGPASSAGLVTALTMALCDAAEQIASRSPRGRLAVPMVGVLDEAANICRWRQLPDLYSHYGSRGIVLLTILQSWSQGAQVWSEAGMKKLWGASNIRVYGGGAAERDFLSDLEAQIGEYNRPVRSPSQSSGRQGNSKSVSVQLTPTPILTVADLAALERDRVIVFPSGAQPILARPVPWWQTEHAKAIEASIEAHDPANATPSDVPPAVVGAADNPYLNLGSS